MVKLDKLTTTDNTMHTIDYLWHDENTQLVRRTGNIHGRTTPLVYPRAYGVASVYILSGRLKIRRQPMTSDIAPSIILTPGSDIEHIYGDTYPEGTELIYSMLEDDTIWLELILSLADGGAIRPQTHKGNGVISATAAENLTAIFYEAQTNKGNGTFAIKSAAEALTIAMTSGTAWAVKT